MGVLVTTTTNAPIFYCMKKIPHWKNRNLENLTQEFEEVIYSEEWKDVQGYEGYYQISSFGRVKSCRVVGRRRENNLHLKIKMLKQFLSLGYPRVAFSIKCKVQYFLAHRLVGQHFIPNPENKPEVNHKYGNTEEAMFFVLEWNTRKENIDHAIRTGLSNIKGSRNATSKLNEIQVLEIIKSSLSKKELAKKYNVSRFCINSILIGKRWSHLTGIKHIKFVQRRFSKDDIIYILKSNKGSTELSKEYNVDCSSIAHIRSGRYYKEIFQEVATEGFDVVD